MRFAAAIVLAIVPCIVTGAAPVIPGYERLAADPGTTPEQRGRVLLSELGCVNCHATDAIATRRAAPDFNHIARITNPAWVHDFLVSNHESDSVMPDPLHGLPDAERRRIATELVFYLYGQPPAFPKGASDSAEAVQRGRALYHRIGCVACHTAFDPPPAPELDDPFFDPADVAMPEFGVPSVPLGALRTKYPSGALAAYLSEPHLLRPSGRMPDMKLSETEAADIAAYLMEQDESAAKLLPILQYGGTKNGPRLVNRFRCLACHDSGSGTNRNPAKPLEALDATASSACPSGEPANGQPRYQLTAAMRADLAAAIEDIQNGAGPPGVEERLAGLAAALNCYACHEFNGIGGPEPGRKMYFQTASHVDMGDEGIVPPRLNGVGAKLTESWLHSILHGEGEVRPYMATRMPDYSATHGEALTALFLEASAGAIVEDTGTGLEHHHRNRYGRELLGVNGLGCITCHELNGHKALGMPGIDLAVVTERLRPEWFESFLLDPAGYRALTRMPAFFPEGKSTYDKLWKGDAVKQIEAMWTYLKEADRSRPPEGMEPSEKFILRPADRPIVHRTFMKDVGTHAIAVGFPGGINYAFDAKDCRLAMIWKGDFISAESAWADRFTPFVEPLGDAIVAMPTGPALARMAEPCDAWPDAAGDAVFSQYALSGSGFPILSYVVDELNVIEQLGVSKAGDVLERRFIVTGTLQNAVIQLVRSRGISRDGDWYVTAEGMRIRIGALPYSSREVHPASTQGRVPVNAAPMTRPVAALVCDAEEGQSLRLSIGGPASMAEIVLEIAW